MHKPLENYAFIDGQNLHKSLLEEGLGLDFERFRIYLKEKYRVGKAYVFIGYLERYQHIYNLLESAGFTLVFKHSINETKIGEIKGNCDVELALQVMIDWNHYQKAILVSGDSDFCCVIAHLMKHQKLAKVLAPTHQSCSYFVRKLAKEKVVYVSNIPAVLR